MTAFRFFGFVRQFLKYKLAILIMFAGDPSLTASISDEELDLIMRVSHTFSLPQLEIICMNHKEKNYHLNQSIATFVNDETVSSMKEMFFNSSQLANISFKVGGKTSILFPQGYLFTIESNFMLQTACIFN